MRKSAILLLVAVPFLLLALSGDCLSTNTKSPKTLLVTPENSSLSSFTGYTRDHWLEICEKMIAGLMPYLDPESGLPKLIGIPEESGHFALQREFIGGSKEAFERTLLLVAIYSAATDLDEVPGYKGSVTEPYLRGIIRGTDPEDPGYWGEREIYDAFGTNIALAMLLSPRFFWDPLTGQQKDRVLKFLRILARTTAYDCNHWYFHLMAVPLLDAHGVESNRPYLGMIFDRLLSWYRGDGWFIDGGNLTFDYYNLWGFQLYNNALCYFDEEWKALYGDRVTQTTSRFLETFPYLFGRDGAPIPWGRSLSYRFAVLSALGWAILNDTSSLPPGQSRRIASGCLKYFWEKGCLSENGLLEPGFHGPNSVVAESYIDRGAPYWAAHGLIFLLLPEDHPFWTSPEEPMPADLAGGRLALPGAQMVLKVSPVDGEAKAIVVGEPVGHEGSWQRGIKYFQHAYSSHLGWAALGEGGPDLGQGRTGVSYDGQSWHYRANPRPVQVDPYHCISIYDFQLDTPERELEDFGHVITHTLMGESGELHIFWHNSARPLYLYLGGYGISVRHQQKAVEERLEDSISAQTEDYYSTIKMVDAPRGEFRLERLKPRQGWSHSHLFGGRGVFPYWQSGEPVPANLPVVAYVAGTRARMPAVLETLVRTEDGLMRVRFEGVTYDIPIPY